MRLIRKPAKQSGICLLAGLTRSFPYGDCVSVTAGQDGSVYAASSDGSLYALKRP